MQAHRLIIAALMTGGLMGCAQAGAATPDPTQDLDCSVVSFYFSGLAEHQGANPTQQRALVAVSKWYSARVQSLAKEHGADQVLERADPLLDAVKHDPVGMRDELSACTDRAIKEGLRQEVG